MQYYRKVPHDGGRYFTIAKAGDDDDIPVGFWRLDTEDEVDRRLSIINTAFELGFEFATKCLGTKLQTIKLRDILDQK